MSEELKYTGFDTRYLTENEVVDVSEIFPGLKLMGTDVKVHEEYDGSLSAVLTGEQTKNLREIAFLETCVAERSLSGLECKFLRRFMGLTQADLGQALSCTRETVNRSEKEGPSSDFCLSLQRLAMSHAPQIVSGWPEAQKNLNRKALEKLHDKISRRVEFGMGFKLSQGFCPILEPANS